MGKTRDLLKKNKKRWKEYMEELYQKKKKKQHKTPNFNNLDNHNGVIITHLEPDILEYEVKWALEWTKLVEVMEFQPSFVKT